MEILINIDSSKKEAKAFIEYLKSLPFVDIKRKTPEESVPKSSASHFAKKWKGFLKNEAIDGDPRFDYLMKKYG